MRSSALSGSNSLTEIRRVPKLAKSLEPNFFGNSLTEIRRVPKL